MVLTPAKTASSAVRRSKHRVKSGCRTCKVRRVKCDEGRPECQRCVTTGRQCDGYGIWGGGHQEQQSLQLLRKHEKHPLPLCVATTFRPEETSHYDWFFCNIRPKLPGLSPSPFWSEMVMQAIHAESAVKHAILAMTAAFRGAADLQRTYRGSNPVPDAEEVFMLQQYSQAFKYLQPHFDPATRSRESNRIVLMTALIFVTLEFLRGNFTLGLRHLQSGLNVLMSGTDDGATTPNARPALLTYEDEQLRDAFYSLGGQLSYRNGGTTTLPTVMEAPDPLKMPPSFSGYCEARKTLNKIISTTSALTRLANERVAYGEHHHDWPSLVQQQRLTRRSFLAWRQASTSQRDGSTDKPVVDQISAAMLRTNGDMAKIMVETSLAEDEMALDDHDADFAAIIANTRTIMAARLTREFKESKYEHGEHVAPFAVEGAFPQPLMYTAMKCRRPSIRREALELIDAVPSRMAILDSRVVSKLAYRYYEVEQRGCSPDEAPPLENRVRLIDISWPDHPHGAMGFSFFARDNGVWKKKKAHLTLRD